MTHETAETLTDSAATGAEPDEPPGPWPSGAPATSPVTVLTADERTEGAPGHELAVDLPTLAGLLADVLAAEGVTSAAEASLTLVDPDEIAALKVEHLDGDGDPTDVLSFPIDGRPGPDDTADGTDRDGTELDGTDRDGTDLCGWLVGDVVVCPEVAARQAPEHAGTLEDELALLVVHAALHLTGWDHADDAERDAMWARERHLLTELHRSPARDPWSGPRP